ncbi:MAG TPA: beta-1,6-N-acetylglucosaminyltransferase [Geodermatophilus sp.]|nr:beta-1,6-N-acetylglucosaminyltransferase [Geodermatophilus sp.]
MTELAAVVLAHRDPLMVRRLVAALDDVPVFLHCDARTPDAVAAEMLRGLPPRVTVLPRRATRLASWSLVAAELAALRTALTATRAAHVAVLSGSDYPLLSVPGLVRELAAWEGRSWLWNVPLPHPPWDTPRHPDGGLWRLRLRYLTRNDHVLYVREIPLRWPVPRAVPAELELRASSQWKVYGRADVERLLQLVDTRPDLLRFWRTTLVPEESFAASMLASPRLTGGDALLPCRADAWLIRWPEGVNHHPDWLTGADFPELARARWASPVDPGEAVLPSEGWDLPGRKLFARKFTTAVDAGVLDRIDAELRS